MEASEMKAHQNPQLTTPSPFELASIAVLLAARDKNPNVSPVNYMPEAIKLLAAAAQHLAQPDEAESHELMLRSLGYTTYKFEEVLKSIEPAPDANKKGKTMVGSITTRQGLIKAVRRIFPKEADEIKGRGSLDCNQIQSILGDQKRRNQLRTEAATKARKPIVTKR
jgi:hypothetical protein